MCAWRPTPAGCIENEILMHFRSQRKLQGEVSLTETLETGGDGSSLSLMDVLAVDDDLLEELDTRDACRRVRRCVQTCLTPRERMVITLRYGLDDRPPRTQREIAARCGIQPVLCIPHREAGAGETG